MERLRSIREDELEGPSREPGVQDQLGERLGRGGRVLGGLPDHRVPAQEGGHDVPRGTATGSCRRSRSRGSTGTRNVKSCLSGISDGTVWPYRRRPSPRKKVQVSMTSCTSPRDSRIGFPISRVMRRERDSACLPRAGRGAGSLPADRAGTAAQVGAPSSPAAGVEERGRVAEPSLDDRLLQAGRVRDLEGSAGRVSSGAAVEQGRHGARRWSSAAMLPTPSGRRVPSQLQRVRPDRKG